MKRGDISILVIDRFDRDMPKGRLEWEIKALSAAGYDVTKERIPRKIQMYDIIIAHPPAHWISDIREFHKEHPNVPVVLHSNNDRGKGKRYLGNEFYIDNGGIYISRYPRIQDFLKFVKYLTGRVRYRRMMAVSSE